MAQSLIHEGDLLVLFLHSSSNAFNRKGGLLYIPALSLEFNETVALDFVI
jgi:hypothetical protein